MYPKVFEDYKADIEAYGDVSRLPTRAYIEPMELGEEISVSLEKGKTLGIKLTAVGTLDAKTGMREDDAVSFSGDEDGDASMDAGGIDAEDVAALLDEREAAAPDEPSAEDAPATFRVLEASFCVGRGGGWIMAVGRRPPGRRG